MPRPQFSLKTLLVATTLVAVLCVVLPRPIRAVRRWLSPTQSIVQEVSPRILILEEDETQLAIPDTDG